MFETVNKINDLDSGHFSKTTVYYRRRIMLNLSVQYTCTYTMNQPHKVATPDKHVSNMSTQRYRFKLHTNIQYEHGLGFLALCSLQLGSFLFITAVLVSYFLSLDFTLEQKL